MQLSEQLFDDILRAMRVTSAPPLLEVGERRQDSRLSVDEQVYLEPFGTLSVLARPVRLCDLSRSGVCISDRYAMKPGETFMLHLPRIGGSPLPVMCIVRNCRLRGEATFRIGAEFIPRALSGLSGRLIHGVSGLAQRQTLDLMHGNVQTVQHLIPDDRRCEPRLDKTMTLRLRSFRDGVCRGILSAEMVDVSTRGMCLVSLEPMQPGQQFAIQPASRVDNFWMLYTVANCGQLDQHRYRIGAAFVRSASISPRGDLLTLAARVRQWMSAALDRANQPRACSR
jgi:hypothetical protein